MVDHALRLPRAPALVYTQRVTARRRDPAFLGVASRGKMPDLLWSFDQLSRFTRYEDPEVRYWAADRLVALFPEEASDVIAPLILDEHDATPELVAEHLGRHGDARHAPALLKGFRKGGGLMPGRCV